MADPWPLFRVTWLDPHFRGLQQTASSLLLFLSAVWDRWPELFRALYSTRVQYEEYDPPFTQLVRIYSDHEQAEAILISLDYKPLHERLRLLFRTRVKYRSVAWTQAVNTLHSDIKDWLAMYYPNPQTRRYLKVKHAALQAQLLDQAQDAIAAFN